MKVKLLDIKNAESALQAIINSSMPIKLAYKMSKLLDQVTSELKAIEKLRVDLVKKYGGEDPSTKNVVVPEENISKFISDYVSLLEAESTLEIIQIPYSLILEADVKLTPLQVVSLKNFLEDEPV